MQTPRDFDGKCFAIGSGYNIGGQRENSVKSVRVRVCVCVLLWKFPLTSSKFGGRKESVDKC